MSKGTTITYDTSEVFDLLKRLNAVSTDLRRTANGRLREAAGLAARELVSELQSGAGGTPQAGIVASSARVKSDRVPAVSIGGSRRVGSRGTPAGEILWGSERGGRNFAAPHNGAGYWIDPAVKRFRASGAVDIYTAAVVDVLQANGVL